MVIRSSLQITLSCLKVSAGESWKVGTLGTWIQTREMSRVKRRLTHPFAEYLKKTRTKSHEGLTQDNQSFLSEVVRDKYVGQSFPPPEAEPLPLIRVTGSPLKGVPAKAVEWTPRTFRAGLIARNIGVYPLYNKDGRKVMTTLLQVLDNHVIKYISPEEYLQRVGGSKYKGKYPRGVLVVGADGADPRLFTKEYCSLFGPSGVLPKKALSRFLVSPGSELPPGTPLFANHFRVGDYVDVAGKTRDWGFQGVVKRFGFKGSPASHGTTKNHRRGGTIGSGRERARVMPGQKMPGHMGSEHRVHRGIQILRINTKYNVIYVRSTGIPGITNSYVRIFDTLIPTKFPKTAPPFPTYFPEDGVELEEDLYHESLHRFDMPSIDFN
ncbi:large ribosomal subunit protein uL3m-like [Artemia franciscana]|uniref:large ribosomal subunit protein uL3m-like n=1 Tax=Artemia franciscana TaxID=6661 RepID=UPI0032DA6554